MNDSSIYQHGSPEQYDDQDTTDGDVIDLRDGAVPVLGLRSPDSGVSFVDLVEEYRRLQPDIDEAIQEVLDRGDYILGQATVALEDEFATYCNTSHAIGTDSGFSALELIFRAFDIGAGDEVVTAANTFYSSVRPIEATGATPVLVDADPEIRNLDPSQIEAAITPATRAILPVHLYGHPAEMDVINEIATEYGLLVFEDACQAHGARCSGRSIGSLGDAAAFSFYPSKNLGAFGDGGMVTTNSEEIDNRLRNLRNLGSTVKYRHEGDGFNRRLDTIQAAVLRVKLRHLDDANKARVQIAEWYQEALADVDVELPFTAQWADPVYHLYVIETPHRDQLALDLNQRGIQTGIHYPAPIHLLPAFESLGYREGAFPVAERLSANILSLPMHPTMTLDDVDYVADSVRHSMAQLTAAV